MIQVTKVRHGGLPLYTRAISSPRQLSFELPFVRHISGTLCLRQSSILHYSRRVYLNIHCTRMRPTETEALTEVIHHLVPNVYEWSTYVVSTVRGSAMVPPGFSTNVAARRHVREFFARKRPTLKSTHPNRVYCRFQNCWPRRFFCDLLTQNRQQDFSYLSQFCIYSQYNCVDVIVRHICRGMVQKIEQKGPPQNQLFMYCEITAAFEFPGRLEAHANYVSAGPDLRSSSVTMTLRSETGRTVTSGRISSALPLPDAASPLRPDARTSCNIPGAAPVRGVRNRTQYRTTREK